MSETKDRIKALRKALGLTQTQLGESLGGGIGIVKNLEDGKTTLKPTMADLIVKLYNVSPIWLETGEGEMFRPLTRQEQITEFVGKVLTDETESFRSQLISILVSLDDIGWYKLEEAVKAIKAAEEKLKR